MRYAQNETENHEDSDYNYTKNTRGFAPRDVMIAPHTGHANDLHPLVTCDRLNDRRRRVRNAGAVIAFPEIGDEELPPDGADEAVGQHAFEAVACLDAVFMVLHGDSDQYAVVFPLLPEFPFFFGIECKFLDALAIEALDREDKHLRGCFLLKLKKECVQLRFYITADDTGQVCHIIPRYCRRLRSRCNGRGCDDR